MEQKIAVIIGAGPAGLTAAAELLEKTDTVPVIYEMTSDIGGISKTVNFKGNRIDIGGHRFFSKSDWVMNWWQRVLPLHGFPARDDAVLGRKVPLSDKPGAPDPEKTDRVMLVRSRLSRIFFLRKFYDYPISLKWSTFRNLGLIRIIKVGFSYIWASAFPIREEKNLEDFLINRFGKELYHLFFEDYTRKVWGVPCREIKPEWGAQRIKGLSITRAVLHALLKPFKKDSSVGQKNVETSLIEQFMYPKLGPGQLWKTVAAAIIEKGADLQLSHEVVGIEMNGASVASVRVKNRETGEESVRQCDAVFSSMPVRHLISAMGDAVCDPEVLRVAKGLQYRDFITVGLLLKKMKVENQTPLPTVNNVIPDNWIYIQERDVKVGRIQIFNNWSPYMVDDPDTVWIGLEYFCNEGDALWDAPDGELMDLGVEELCRIDLINKDDVLDRTVIRMPKAYPAYFGTYDEFDKIRKFTDEISNLFLIGRNGMHRYNNADHSMLTAKTAVDLWLQGDSSKDLIWSVNAEAEYHEEKSL